MTITDWSPLACTVPPAGSRVQFMRWLGPRRYRVTLAFVLPSGLDLSEWRWWRYA